MATKKNEAQETARVSKLPLPLSDQPLVIDLPDGQKLVIGKMTQGSVIEVATWRGTGRPDSRTSRLMLGMSVNESNEPASAQSAGYAQVPSAPQGKQAPLDVAKAIAESVLKKIISTSQLVVKSAIPFTKALIGKITKRTPSKISHSAPQQIENVSPRPVSEDSEIEEWLNKLTERAAKKSAREAAAAAGIKKQTPKKSASKRTSASKKSVKKR